MEDDNPSKKKKVNCCLICGQVARYTNSRHIYTNILKHLLIPKNLRENKLFIVFDYCVSCAAELEELNVLNRKLGKIIQSIRKNVESLKYIMLMKRDTESCDDYSVNLFRNIAVEDLSPSVKMTQNNLLANVCGDEHSKYFLETVQKKINNQLRKEQDRKDGSLYNMNKGIVPCYDKWYCPVKETKRKSKLTELMKEETPETVTDPVDTSSTSLEEEDCHPPCLQREDENPPLNEYVFQPEEVIVNIEADVKDFEWSEEIVKFEPWNESERDDQDPLMKELDQPTCDFSEAVTEVFENAFEPTPTETITIDSGIQDYGSYKVSPRIQRKPPGNSKTWRKPTLSMTQFAILALRNGPKEGMFVHQIIKFIESNFPYYQSTQNWKFLLRSALSSTSCFVRETEVGANVKVGVAGLWTLNNEKITHHFKTKIAELCTNDCVAFPDRIEKMCSALFNEGNDASDNDANWEQASCSQYLNQPGKDDNENNQINVTSSLLNEVIDDEDILFPKTNESNDEVHCSIVESKPNIWPRPQLSLVQLIILAIKCGTQTGMTYLEIHQFLIDTFPYYKPDLEFKNLIAHTLRTRKLFVVATRGLMGLWIIHPKVKYSNILKELADNCVNNEVSFCSTERLNEAIGVLTSFKTTNFFYRHIIYLALRAKTSGQRTASSILRFMEEFFPLYDKSNDQESKLQQITNNLSVCWYFKSTFTSVDKSSLWHITNSKANNELRNQILELAKLPTSMSIFMANPVYLDKLIGIIKSY